MDSYNVDNNLIGSICKWLENEKNKIVDLCCELIQHKSPTGEESEIQYFLFDLLKKELEPDYLKMIEVKENRPNIVMVLGKDNTKNKGLLLNAHVDVVDVNEKELQKWSTDPWTPTIIEEKIYGRGANDMKGGIAALIWALKALKKFDVKLNKNVGLELVVGEELMEHEIGTTAATKALKDDGYEFEFALIPEPTNLEVHVISPGAFVLEIKVMGREVHDGVRNVILYPQPWGVPSGSDVGADAIEKIVLIYNALRYLERDVIMRWKHKLLGGGGYPRGPDLQGVGSFFNLNIALIEGGTYISSVPGYAKISANCYYPPWLSFEDVKNLILKTLDSLASYDSWLARNPPKVSFSMLWPPYETEINNPYCEILALSIKEATQKEVVYSGFKAVCDVSFLQPFGIKGVCFGPGDLTMGSHGPNEYVPIHQIIDAAKSIATFLIRTCNNK